VAKAEFIRARVDEQLKENMETLFSKLGITMTEAITMFFMQCQMQQGLPFEVKVSEKASGEYVAAHPDEFKPLGAVPRIVRNPHIIKDFHKFTREELHERSDFC